MGLETKLGHQHSIGLLDQSPYEIFFYILEVVELNILVTLIVDVHLKTDTSRYTAANSSPMASKRHQ